MVFFSFCSDQYWFNVAQNEWEYGTIYEEVNDVSTPFFPGTLIFILMDILAIIVMIFGVKIVNQRASRLHLKPALLLILSLLVAFCVAGFSIAKSIIAINYNQQQSSWPTQHACTDDFEVVKPIIYLYPETDTEINVKLGNPEKLAVSYPEYTNDGWSVLAHPDGSLIDLNSSRSLYALYWEGSMAPKADFSTGFIVKGEAAASFLEEKLAQLGLNEREAEEFIVYWLPQMQNNEYNLVHFASSEEINNYMPLEFSTQPDTIIRIYMQLETASDNATVTEQILPETPARDGFTVVEWGGTNYNLK